MKKRGMVALIVLFVALPFSLAICTDSDNGKDFYTAGIVTITDKNSTQNFSDNCKSETLLEEWYCKPNKEPDFITKECTCQESRCIYVQNASNTTEQKICPSCECTDCGSCYPCNASCNIGESTISSISSLRIFNSEIYPKNTFPGSNVTINATITDILPIISAQCLFLLNNITVYNTSLESKANGMYQITLNSSVLARGTYKAKILAKNIIGQEKEKELGEITIESANIKKEFVNKTAFLISDSNWKNVLQMVPVAIGDYKNQTIKNPLLIYYYQNYTNKEITISPETLKEETGLYLSWNIKNHVFARGTNDKNEFQVLFTVDNASYDLMMTGGPVGYVNYTAEKINSSAAMYYFDVYMNGYYQQTSSSINGNLQIWPIYTSGCNANRLKKGLNNLTIKIASNGNMRIKDYVAYNKYFSTDVLYDNCNYVPENLKVYDLCISSAETYIQTAKPGDIIDYSIIVKNPGKVAVDLSGQETILQGSWIAPETLGDLYKVPYSTVFSHLKTEIPKIKLNPGLGTVFNIKLIYNKSTVLNNESFDIDSAIHFMQQYKPKELVIVGNTNQELDNLLVANPPLGAGIIANNIKRISPNDILSYWTFYEDVVYSEDNYETALMASVYASLLNAPLIIRGTDLDKPNVYSGKKLICIGEIIDKNCSETYSSSQLQKKYIEKTKTDKVIIINPDDLDLSIITEYKPDKSIRKINKLYSKASLSAPILASAKKELIIPIKSKDYLEVDRQFNEKLAELNFSPEFLTIVSDQNAIPISRKTIAGEGCLETTYDLETDGRVYGDLNNDNLIELSTGRIFGITSTDASSTIARSIFAKEIALNTVANYNALVVMPGYDDYTTEAEMVNFAKYFWTDQIKSKFNSHLFYAGYQNTWTKYQEIRELYTTANMAIFYDHGSPYSFQHMIDSSYLISNKKYLNNLIVLDVACLTCTWYKDPTVICDQHMRRGALGFQGATETSYWNKEFDETLNGFLLEGKAIGTAYKEARNKDYADRIYNFCYGTRGDIYYAWIGDPTLTFSEVKK